MRYALAVARFYEGLAERLVLGARTAFMHAGDPEVEVFDVPGAFELPLAASYAATSGRFDGVACLGAVIRGETDHYEFVCAETASGVMRVAARHRRAVRLRRAHLRDDGAGAARALAATSAIRADTPPRP